MKVSEKDIRPSLSGSGDHGPITGSRDHIVTPLMESTVKEATRLRVEVFAPSHYISPSGLQVIDVQDAFDLNRNRAAALKYLLRAGKKDPSSLDKEIQDLDKLIWYIEREKKRLKGALDVAWTSSPRPCD